MYHGVDAIERHQPVVALGNVASNATDISQALRPGPVRVDARNQTVKNGHRMASAQERVNDVGSNESGATCHEDVHGSAAHDKAWAPSGGY